jgi:hypothetical protein
MYAWKSHFVVQADYQHWANEVMFTALDYLQPDVLDSDQGLFFNSIHHTADHMLLVSQSWLARLQGEQLSLNYKVINTPDWRELKLALRRETRKLQNWLEAQPLEFFDSQIAFVVGARCADPSIHPLRPPSRPDFRRHHPAGRAVSGNGFRLLPARDGASAQRVEAGFARSSGVIRSSSLPA